MSTTGAEQMFLVTIKKLSEKTEHVKNVDIQNDMKLTKSTVSERLKRLDEKGLIINDKGDIKLTSLGQQIADDTDDIFVTLIETFVALGADEKLARSEADIIEHVISPELVNIFKDFVKKKKNR